MTFSVVSENLDQRLSRRALEDAIKNVSSLTRADCVFINEDWFGIIASDLELTDAAEFQRGLRAHGCETSLVPDSDIPALHNDFRCKYIDFNEDTLNLRTAMNRPYPRKIHELVFIAAGSISRERMVSRMVSPDPILQAPVNYMRHHSRPREVAKIEKQTNFRIDLFFSNDPFRISLELNDQNVIIHAGQAIRMRNTEGLMGLLSKLKALIPAERMNRGLQTMTMETIYPSFPAYQEELRWMFYRLGARG